MMSPDLVYSARSPNPRFKLQVEEKHGERELRQVGEGSPAVYEDAFHADL